MQVIGKVIEKLPLKTGSGTHGQWSIAQLVVEFTDGSYNRQICLQNSKDANAFNALQVGVVGTFHFDVTSRKAANGSWYTSANCYKWDVKGSAGNDDMPV